MTNAVKHMRHQILMNKYILEAVIDYERLCTSKLSAAISFFSNSADFYALALDQCCQ